MHKIMLVDDEVTITTHLEARLSSMGYEVVGRASSGEESVSMARSLSPDLILMDIVMPGELDGIDASEKIKAELDIPIVFLTAYTDDKFIKRAKEVDPFGYIVKPYNENEIRATIEVALHKKDAERRLHFLVEKYRSIINSLNYAIISTDNKGDIVFWSRGAETTFGYSADEAAGRPLTFILPERFRDEYENEMNRMLSNQKSNIIGKIVECIGLRKKGTEFPFEFSLAFWKRKNIIFFTCIGRDISHRRRMEIEKERRLVQLIQSEKMRGISTLADGIAHEINNLLQIMSGNVQIAQKTEKPEDIRKAFDVVLNTSEKAAKIAKDLWIFAKQEPSERELCAISMLIESTLSLIEEQLKSHNIKVVRRYKKTPKILINKSEMQQVFLDLITNARDAMLPKGGKLDIEVKKVKKGVTASFSDTGKGIEEEDLGKVFEPFYTTKGAIGRDSKLQGTGLGLSVSYGIVNRHGGTIEVESKVGQGTTFTVKLPVKGEGNIRRYIRNKEKQKLSNRFAK